MFAAALPLVVLLDTVLNIDFSGMLDQAFTLANSLWPIFVVPIGLALGIGLVSWIASEIKSTMKFK